MVAHYLIKVSVILVTTFKHICTWKLFSRHSLSISNNNFRLSTKSKGESFQNKIRFARNTWGEFQLHYLTMCFEGHSTAEIWNNQEEYYRGDDKLFQQELQVIELSSKSNFTIFLKGGWVTLISRRKKKKASSLVPDYTQEPRRLKANWMGSLRW
jgi:hypothetical protein